MATETVPEALFDDFLKELQALDEFRARYAARHEFEGVGKEDQDVRRLIEALAFYSARTRRVSERAFSSYKRRVLEKLFPHLLSPMPQMALLHPELDSNMQEVRSLKAMTSITAHLPPAERARPPVRLRTREEATLWPFRFVRRSLRFERRAQPAEAGTPNTELGWSLRFSLATSSEAHVRKRFYENRERSFRALTLFIDSGTDPLLASRLFYALARSLKVARCRFVSDAQELHSFETSGVTFGTGEHVVTASYENPIERVRRLVHFPAAELRFTIPIVGAPAEWDRLDVDLELDAQWPVGLALTEGSLLLNAVVVENLERQSAEPVDVDGRSARLPIVHPEPNSGMVLRELLAVYKGNPAVPGQRRAVFPNLLVEGGFSVDIEAPGHAWLEIDDVAAPDSPATRLYLEGEWYQPDGCDAASLNLARYATDSVELALVRWRLAGHQSPTRNALAGDATLLDRLVDVHGKSDMNLDDLSLLLRVLGVEQSELFRRIPKFITKAATTVVRDVAASTGAVRNLDVVFANLPPQLLPPVWLLFRSFPQLLSNWMGDCDVKVRLSFEGPGNMDPLTFSWSANHG